MNLIIDIGNTVAKVALFDRTSMVEVVYDSNQSLDSLEAVCNKYDVRKAIVATVIDLNECVLAQLNKLPVPVLWLDSHTPLPVINLYETPETLGYDRMAAVVAAHDQFPGKDILVIDAGTCITYEFVDSLGQYHGGNISPGLWMRLKALHQFTGRLPLVHAEGRMPDMGKDTETAIRAGVKKGIEYEIAGYITAMKHKYPELLVFLTGGDDFSFDTKLKSVIFADRFLVLKGLNRILNYNNTNFSSEGTKLNAKNSSFDYIAMQFRLHQRVAMSIGLLPYSSVGYNMAKANNDVASEEARSVTSFAGDGGLHQLYVGLGVKVLKNLSVGANVSYFWGEITRQARITFPYNDNAFAFQHVDYLSVRDYKLDFGAQYTQQLGRKHAVTLGVVFSPKKDLHNEAYVQRSTLTNSNSTQAVTTNTVDTVATFGMPNSFGVGLTYEYDKRLIVGADFNLQKWGDVTYMNQPNAFCDAMKISVGAEYMPSRFSRSYLAHIKYRVGGYYSEPYYKIGGERASREYGVTAGLGLPLPGSRSLINVSAQYIKVHGLKAGMVDENTLRLSIGITFNEGWFFKRKVK